MSIESIFKNKPCRDEILVKKKEQFCSYAELIPLC